MADDPLPGGFQGRQARGRTMIVLGEGDIQDRPLVISTIIITDDRRPVAGDAGNDYRRLARPWSYFPSTCSRAGLKLFTTQPPEAGVDTPTRGAHPIGQAVDSDTQNYSLFNAPHYCHRQSDVRNSVHCGEPIADGERIARCTCDIVCVSQQRSTNLRGTPRDAPNILAGKFSELQREHVSRHSAAPSEANGGRL